DRDYDEWLRDATEAQYCKAVVVEHRGGAERMFIPPGWWSVSTLLALYGGLRETKLISASPFHQPVSTKTSETAKSPFSRANSLPRNRIKMASAKSHTSGDESKKGVATKKGVVKPELHQVKHNLGELKKTLEVLGAATLKTAGRRRAASLLSLFSTFVHAAGKGDQEKPGEQSKATSTTGGAPSRSPFTRGVNPQLGTEWTDEDGRKQRSFRSYLHKPRVPPQQTKEPKEIPVDFRHLNH
ncbi:hypothetical protein FOZ63_006794, partial [Perkinsus olseni]